MKQFVAAKAFIEHDGRILVLQEADRYEEGTNAGSYDVPGGRIQPGEHHTEALQREIYEETGLDVRIHEVFFVGEWTPTIDEENCQIIGIYFACSTDIETVTLSVDHSNYAWIDPKQHRRYKLIPSLHATFEKYLSR